MLPDDTLSSHSFPYSVLGGRANGIGDLLDYETGGVGIQDPSLGLTYQTWRARYIAGHVVLDAPNVSTPIVVFTGDGVTEISVSFTENMDYVLAYVQNGTAYLKWPNGGSYTTTSFGTDMKHPKVSLDEKRPIESNIADVLLAYIRDGNLCVRKQRDNYGVEIILSSVPNHRLIKFGMGTDNRVQFVLTRE